MGEARAGPVMNRVLHTRPVISRVLAEAGGKPRLRLWVYRTGESLAETSEKPRLRLWVYRTGD